MFSRFEMDGEGALYVRSVDIRALRDSNGATILTYEPTPGELFTPRILGTADENMERLRQEETDMLIASEKLRARQQNGYPAMPVIRGRK